MTRQMQLCVVILRKCKEIDQCPHVISTSASTAVVARLQMQPCFLKLKINDPNQATLQSYRSVLLTKFALYNAV